MVSGINCGSKISFVGELVTVSACNEVIYLPIKLFCDGSHGAVCSWVMTFKTQAR
jgi:hypothetical protein